MSVDFGLRPGERLAQDWQKKQELGQTDVSGNLEQLADHVSSYAKNNFKDADAIRADLLKDAWQLRKLHNDLSKMFIKGDYMDPNSQDRIAVLEVVKGFMASFKTKEVQSLIAQTFIQRM